MSDIDDAQAYRHRLDSGHSLVSDAGTYICLDCVWSSTGEDKRTGGDELCRHTTMLGPLEFICINLVHDVGAARPRHHYVRRYPFGNH